MAKQKYNPIEDYFADRQENTSNDEPLFTADDEDIDLKTEVKDAEIKHIATLKYNDLFLQEIGVKPVYSAYINKYLRLKVSKDRQSRKEAVEVRKTAQEYNETSIKDNLRKGLGL